MVWATPPLADIRRQSRDGVAARLPTAGALPANSPARVIADNNAGLAYEVLLFVANQAKTFLPDMVEGAPRWGDILFGGRKAATFATGSATFTGLAGLTIPEGTSLTATTAAGAILFATTAEIVLGSVATSAPIVALDAGSAANLDTGTSLSLTAAVPGADATATVVLLRGGTDAETDEELQGRVLERLRKPPMGGSADDYVAWAKEVPGVTRAWCSPGEMGPGTVTVRFMMDDLRADSGGYPQPADVAAVQAHVFARRPVTALDCFVVAPLPEPLDITVTGLFPDTPSTWAAVLVSLRAMLRDRAAPAHAVNGVAQPAETILACWINEAITHATGVVSFDPVTEDYEMPSPGHMAELGSLIHG